MSLLLRITDAGRQALVNADNTGTLPITIDKIAIGRAKYITTDNQTALQQPIKLINTFGGGAVADDVIHISVFDDSNEEYPLGEFALITNTGVFFAVCSDPDDYIMTKNAAGILLLAADIKVSTVNAGDIIFDGINFVLPPGTTETAGLLRLADFEETIEGENNSKAVTPAGLKAILDLVLAGKLNIDDLEDHPAIIKLMENTMQPIGTTVENYLAANDPDANSWVKLGPNVTADLNIYPKLAGLQSPGPIVFSGAPANNLTAQLALVAGSWSIARWRIVNGLHIVLAIGSSVSYYRCFTSPDGVTFTERGNLTHTANISGTQINLYFCNGKYYGVSNYGVWESSDAITWVKKTSTYYYSMTYAFGLYIFGDSNGGVYTTPDFVTFTKRITMTTSGPVVNFELANGRLVAAVFTSGLQVKYVHTANGIDWTEALITALTESNNISYYHVRVLNNKFYFIGDTRNFTLESANGVDGWTVVPTVSSGSAGYDNSSVVALDTLYCKNNFSTDMSKTPRATNLGNSLDMGFDGQSVWAASLASTAITFSKAPAVNNANRVYLPNQSNKMMKVK